MQPAPNDFTPLLTEAIDKLTRIFGPDITRSKLRKIPGITFTHDASVGTITADANLIAQQLIDEFSPLSPFVVNKTIVPLLEPYLNATKQPDVANSTSLQTIA